MPDRDSIAERLAALPAGQKEALEKLLRRRSSRAVELRRRTPGTPVPLAYGQRRLWLLDQLTPGNPAYNETNSLRFRIPLDVAVLRRAVNEIVRRHEILRMGVHADGGELFQEFAPSLELEIPLIDLRQMPAAGREPEALRIAGEQSRVPFELGQAPLLRASVYRLDTEDFLFVLTMHHIVCDGWSMGVFMVELTTLYWNFLGGTPSPFLELPVQYGDYAVWQHRALPGDVQKASLDYWRQRLKDLPVVDLPADRLRPAEFSFRGARQRLQIAGSAFAALNALAAQRNTTPFMVLLAVFAVLLHRYTGQDDLVIGTPSVGRSRNELEPVIGFFVNSLVLRLNVTGEAAFEDVLDGVQRAVLEAFEHQEVPFERLVEELQPKRDPSRTPLFQVMFQLFQPPSAAGLSEDLFLPFTPIDSGISKSDLSLELISAKDAIRGHIEYNTDLFEAGRIERMIGHFLRLIESATSNPAAPVSLLGLLTPEEEDTLVHQWSGTSAPYPRDRTVPEEFLAQAERTPDAPAVSFGGQVLSYAELREKAAAIAAELYRRGVRRGDFVGLYLSRCLELPAALLGILQAGAAYVPLDPEYPQERLAFLLADSGVKVVLTELARVDELREFDGAVVAIDGSLTAGLTVPPPAGGSATDIAYLMYTSGTTGQPKGVAVTHRSILRLVKGVTYVDLAGPHTMLQFAPVSFDASTFEVWGCLLNGGKLAVYPVGLPSLEELGAFIRSERVSILFLTTNLFRQMVEHCPGDLRSVGQIIFGGEAMPAGCAKSAWMALPRSRIANAYGPTECTTFATMYPIGSPEMTSDTVPIGRPIENTTAYVLDRYGNPAPVGLPGELYLGGDGVAQGYWKRDALTAERFVADPFHPEGRLYRTGDIVAFREDGNLLFFGRRDRQVKVSGYRIELGEIEVAIETHPDVAAAVVVVTGGDEKRLDAFYQARESNAPSSDELRRYLSARLPRYMVPARLQAIDELPLTASGKIDRQALVFQEDSSQRHGFVAPRNTLETALAGIWSELLQLERVGVTDNFFDLGGQSLVATRVLSRIRAEFGGPITMREFFDHPTVAELALLLSGRSTRVAAVAEGRE